MKRKVLLALTILWIGLFLLNIITAGIMLTRGNTNKVSSTDNNKVETQNVWYNTPNMFMVFNAMNFNKYSYESVLKINNKTGDFTDWTNGNNGNYPFVTFTDTGKNVTAITGAHGYLDDNWYKMTKDISFPAQLALINRLLLNISLYAYTTNSFCAFELHFYVNLYFADGSHIMIGAYDDANNHEYYDKNGYWWRFPLTNPIAGINYTPACQFSPSDLPNEYVNRIEYVLHVKCWEMGNYGLKIKIITNYEVFASTIANRPMLIKSWYIPVSEMEKGNDVWFYASITGAITNLEGSESGIHSSFLTLGITSPLGIQRSYNMTWAYESYSLNVYGILVTGITDLTEIGTYLSIVAIVMNTLNIGIINFTTQTFEIFAIGLAYPRSAYLSLFSTLDGLPLSSTNFKIYVGNDEERQLLDFKTYFSGDWTPIGFGNANYSFIDDYIQMQLGNNSGLQTQFKVLDPLTGARDIISRYDYNTLKFEIKPLNSFLFEVRFNTPEEYYYIYNITSSMVGYWWDITIPIFNFTKIAEIYRGYLNAIGFKVKITQGTSGDFLLTNVRLSQYYTPVWNYQNISTCRTETQFDIAGSIKSNVTVSNNQTLQLFPMYNATYSFESNTIGSHPNGWTVYEGAGTSIKVIQENTVHNKIIEFNDTSTNYCSAENNFAHQARGTIEFWIKITNPTKNRAFFIQSYAIGYGGIYMQIAKGMFQADIGSLVNITGCMNNTWTHIRLTFECLSGGFDGLSANRYNVYINGTKYGSYGFLGSTTFLNYFFLETDTTPANYKIYIDAVDYNWTSGWFLNRNKVTNLFGSYISSIYDLSNALQYKYYALHYAISKLNMSNEIILQYRFSANNSLWGVWSNYIMTNQTLNLWGERYFQFKVSMQAVNDYAIKECYWVNLTYLLDNDLMEGYLINPYRLCSPANRQVPTNLQFVGEWETVCITDYFNTVLFRQRIQWAFFIDIGLPIFTLTVINLANFSVIARLYRDYGMYIEIVLAPNSMASIQALATNYALEIRDLDMNLLVITSLSPYSERMVTYTFITPPQGVSPPSPPTSLYVVYGLIIIVIIFIFADMLYSRYLNKKSARRERIKEIGSDWEMEV
jgi:hypothetical protein